MTSTYETASLHGPLSSHGIGPLGCPTWLESFRYEDRLLCSNGANHRRSLARLTATLWSIAQRPSELLRRLDPPVTFGDPSKPLRTRGEGLALWPSPKVHPASGAGSPLSPWEAFLCARAYAIVPAVIKLVKWCLEPLSEPLGTRPRSPTVPPSKVRFDIDEPNQVILDSWRIESRGYATF